MMARPLEFEELVSVLVAEHVAVFNRLRSIREALAGRRHAKARELVPQLCDDLRQHIIDEEARVLKVLIDAYGRKGAEEAIKTFQQHRTIHNRIEEIEALALRTPGLLEPKIADLEEILRDHVREEESRIFPWAVETYRKQPK